MSTIEKRKLKSAVADEVRFLCNWMGRPLTTGAVSPSGKALTKLMASFVDPADPRPVVELGPGTGVVTKALLDRGVAPERLLFFSDNPRELTAAAAAGLPVVHVVRAEEGTASDPRFPEIASFDAVELAHWPRSA